MAWHTALGGMGLSPTRIAQFRLSLLVSLGIVPVACGGTTRGEPQADGGGGSGGSPSSAGTTSKAGTNSSAGTTGSAGTSSSAGTASTGSAGSPSSAGAPSTGGGPGQIVPCTSPVSDPVTGFVTCAEGFVHRPTAVVCGA